MTGKLRYVLAAAFLALLFLVPTADKDYLGFLQTRSWLSGDDSPLAKLREGRQLELEDGKFEVKKGVLVPLAAGAKAPDLGSMPPVLLDIKPRKHEEEYARIAKQWAQKESVTIQRDVPACGLQVIAGDKGTLIRLLMYGADRKERIVATKTIPVRVGAISELSYRPNRWSLLPAFLAIALAILTGKVIISLLVGCLAGSFLFVGGNPISAVTHFATVTLHDVLVDDFKLKIMGFVIFLFMAVGVMTRSGGVQGMVDWVRKYAKGPVSSQLCSFIVGVLVFFDDYTNCVLTGTTMRPLTDKNRVSREKLSYIVDSTAAPIAGICIFSTWVAYEISMFAPQLPEVLNEQGLPYKQEHGFEVFLQTLPFRFYCIFTLVMVVLTIVLKREFGPMLTAERRARHEGKPTADDAKPMVSGSFKKLDPPDHIPHRARNAFIPIVALMLVTLGLFVKFGIDGSDPADLKKAAEEGVGAWIRTVLYSTDSTMALLLAAASAFVLASALALGQGLMSVKDVAVSASRSAFALGFAVIILILAWAIGRTCDDVGTNQFLTAAFGQAFSPWLLPAILFLLSSLVAFSTGTSYGTMAILLPNVVILAHTMGTGYEGFGGPALMILTIGAVLEGSIFGDHCSPISDTTVLSSVSTGSDHLHHVRTQAPYAVFVMLISMVFGYIPVALWGLSMWPLAWAGGGLALVAGLFVLGRRV